ncbi:hypothetical protein J7E62_09355 [Variovorax paradoxus]|nr:hypothetical protein [Variovorax paradoxus]
MKKTAALLFALALAGCASTNYQAYEGRTDQIIEGQGGTKEMVDGFEIWDNGNPPRRYKVLGVATVEDFDNGFGQQRIRSAMADQIRQAGGDAAVLLDGYSQGQSATAMFGPKGRMAFGTTTGKKQIRFQIVQYMDKPAAKAPAAPQSAPPAPATPASTWIRS